MTFMPDFEPQRRLLIPSRVLPVLLYVADGAQAAASAWRPGIACR